LFSLSSFFLTVKPLSKSYFYTEITSRIEVLAKSNPEIKLKEPMLKAFIEGDLAMQANLKNRG
jgi:hypothetical protein